MANKKTKKTMTKKDLKKTKGGLNFAITGNTALKSDVVSEKGSQSITAVE